MSNILFIDSSYVSFQCFFKTKKWFLRLYPNTKVEDIEWHNESTFLEKYEQEYKSIIRRIVKSRQIRWNDVIIVKDCPRNEIWRHDIFDKYKATREENNKHFKGGLVFKYTHQTIFPKLKKDKNLSIVRIQRAEADDVISIIHKEYRSMNPTSNIFILSVDSDYVQLLDKNTFIINIYNKFVKQIKNIEEYVLYKILNGDKSDNIPKCFGKRIKKETCKDIVENEQVLEELFIKYNNSRKKYNLNKNLILFDRIPENIKSEVIKWMKESWLKE